MPIHIRQQLLAGDIDKDQSPHVDADGLPWSCGSDGVPTAFQLGDPDSGQPSFEDQYGRTLRYVGGDP